MKHFFRAIALLASSSLLLVFAANAHGELITVRFAGTVTGVSVQNRPELQGFDFPQVGDPFVGFYRFESTAQDTAASPSQGSFHTTLQENAVVASIGNLHFEGVSTSIVTFQDQYEVGDHLPKIELTSDPVLGQLLNVNHFSLVVEKDNLYSDPNLLPLSPPSLDGVLQSYLRMISYNINDPPGPLQPWVTIVASLDYLAIVPEPATPLLFGFACIFLPMLRRKR
jgi:hypothetical protein